VDESLTNAFSFPDHPMAPRPAQAIRLAEGQETLIVGDDEAREVESDLSANEDRARANLREQIDRQVSDWLAEAGLPREWKAPRELVNRMVLGTPVVEVPENRGYGDLYRASVPVEFSLSNKTLLVREYQRQMAAHRLGLMAAVLCFVLACLAVISGYIRTDEATRGYYTAPLRVAALGAVVAAGFALYRVMM
jgi:hypothetical protein